MTLITCGILPYLLRPLQRGKIRQINFNPLEWDPHTEKFNVQQNYHAGYVITSVFLITSALSIVSLISYDDTPDKAIQGFFTVVEGVFACLHWFFICHSSDFTKFFNGLMTFERKYGAGYLPGQNKTRLLKLLCKLQYHSIPFLIIVVAFTAALAPASPFNAYNIFYQSLQKPQPQFVNSSVKYVMNFVTIWSLNAALWWQALPVLNFVISCNVAVAFYALGALPWMFHRFVAESLSRSNTDAFNVSRLSKIISTTAISQSVGVCFREFQILCNLYNDIHLGLIIEPLSLSSMTSQIVYLFILVTYNTNEGVMIFAFSFVIFINAAAFDIACYGEAANVRVSCKSVMQKLRRNLMFIQKNKTDTDWLKKFIKSCPFLGISFFRNSYFDKVTPLKIEHFCIDKTVVLLLVNS